MRIICVFNAFSTRIRQGQIDRRYCNNCVSKVYDQFIVSSIGFIKTNVVFISFTFMSTLSLSSR